jgi:hypothetical protein
MGRYPKDGIERQLSPFHNTREKSVVAPVVTRVCKEAMFLPELEFILYRPDLRVPNVDE